MNNLLIAEEELIVAKDLADMAKCINGDLNITITEDAKEALKYVKSNCYDLFFLSMEFRNCTGIELVKRIRETKSHESTPIFFIVSVPLKKFCVSGMSYSDIRLLPEMEIRRALEVLEGGIEKDDDCGDCIIL